MNINKTKIAICANDQNEESKASSRFARCEYYSIYDHRTLKFSFVSNIAKEEMSGAGNKAAKILSDLGVEIVLVPEIGPKAFDTLKAFDIDVFQYSGELSVRDTLYKYFEDQLKEITAPSKKGKH